MRIPGKFTIPNDIEGVMGLLMARGWERSAIVYAYTKNARGGMNRENPTHPYSFSEFAALGINGLRDQETVAIYHQHWTDAMKKRKAHAVKPGDTIQVPDLKFPPTDVDSRKGSAFRHTSKEKIIDAIKSNPDIVKDAVKSDPQVANAAYKGIVEKQDEKRAAFRKEREAAGIKPDVFDKDIEPVWKDSTLDNLMTAAVDEAGRREALKGLLFLAQKGRDAMQKLLEDHSYTGVEDEIDWLHEMTAALTDWQWAATGFIAETSSSEESR